MLSKRQNDRRYSNGYGHYDCYSNRHYRNKFRTNCRSQSIFRWRNRRFSNFQGTDQKLSVTCLAQVPNNAKLDYLKLHLTGGALVFLLEIPTEDRDTFDKAIQALENRYRSANRIELFKLKFQKENLIYQGRPQKII